MDLDAHAVEEYFASQPDVEAAFLFGSRARGDATAGSDVDIAVLLRHDAPDEPLRIVRLTNALMDVLGRSDVDVVSLNDAPALLQHRVARDGRVLFATSNTAVAEFVIRAVQNFEDTRPLREIQAMQTRQYFSRSGETD